MELLNLTGLAVSAAISSGLAGMPPAGIRSESNIQPETTQVVLTVDALSRMTAFWATFTKEPPQVRDVARLNNQKRLPIVLDLGTSGQTQVPLMAVDMVAMATKYPSVVADFKQADLTPEQWEQLRLSLYTATATEQVAKLQGLVTPEASSSVVGQNIAFLHAHQKELQELKATGMWFPTPKTQGGDDGSDLDP